MTKLTLELKAPKAVPDGLEVGIDGEALETLVDVAIVGCRALQAAGYSFVVRGLGEERWSTDISYDFAIVLEQLPEVIDALAIGASTKLGFFGQGVERVIGLVPTGSAVIATNMPLIGGANETCPSEELDLDVLVGQLRALVAGFIHGIRTVAPALLEAQGVVDLERFAT